MDNINEQLNDVEEQDEITENNNEESSSSAFNEQERERANRETSFSQQARNPEYFLPWQFSTAGIVIGFLFGGVNLILALYGNYLFKNNKTYNEIKTAYNIIFIISIIFLILIFFIFIIAILVRSFESPYYY